MSEERRLEKEVVLNATPEQVWEAVATGPGISTWFVPHEVDEDGEMLADFGSGNTSSGRVLAIEPGRRVVYGGSEESPDEAIEFLVGGREGGSTVLRLIHSGYAGEDWQAEYHSKGWDGFLHNLVQYFDHFAGLPVVNVVTMNFTDQGYEQVWAALRKALGVDRAVARGDQVRLTPEGLEPLAGVVDVCERGVLGLRTGDGLYRFAGEGADAWGMVMTTHYLYGVDAERAETTAAWQAWLDRLFPAST